MVTGAEIDAFGAGMVLRARALGRAVAAAGRRRVVLHPEAVGIAGLAMAGERSGLWAVAAGKLRRGQPAMAAAGDARDRGEQLRLWRELARAMSSWGDHEPQLAVPDRATAGLLAESATRFRHHEDPDVRRAAETVWWCFTRRQVAGSHAMVVLTDVLAEHFAIGHDGGPPDDLRVWLAWVGATDHDDLAGRLERRLAEPPAPHTGAAFDESLWPKVQRRAAERKERAALAAGTLEGRERQRAEADIARQARNRAAVVKAALGPVLRHAWARLYDAWVLMGSDNRPVVAGIERACRLDAGSWAAEERRRAGGIPMARRDSPRRAVLELATAQQAAEWWRGALVWDDPVERARAVFAGVALSGVVVGADGSDVVVSTTARVLRVRPGDELVDGSGGGRTSYVVGEVSEEAGGRTVELQVTDGPVPGEGSHVELLPPPARDAWRVGRLAKRLARDHWVLGGAPPAAGRPAGPDGTALIDAVEALGRAGA